MTRRALLAPSGQGLPDLQQADIDMDPSADLKEMTAVYRTVKPIVEAANRLPPVVDVDVPDVRAVRPGGEP